MSYRSRSKSDTDHPGSFKLNVSAVCACCRAQDVEWDAFLELFADRLPDGGAFGLVARMKKPSARPRRTQRVLQPFVRLLIERGHIAEEDGALWTIGVLSRACGNAH